MSNQPFHPAGNKTYARAVTAASTVVTPASIVVPNSTSPLDAGIAGATFDYRFTVVGTVPVFLAFAAASAAAPTAAIPADGANGFGLPVEAGQTRTFSLPYGTQVAAIASGVGSSVYVTIGTGNNT